MGVFDCYIILKRIGSHVPGEAIYVKHGDKTFDVLEDVKQTNHLDGSVSWDARVTTVELSNPEYFEFLTALDEDEVSVQRIS